MMGNAASEGEGNVSHMPTSVRSPRGQGASRAISDERPG